jgi:hypothetical protein
MGGQPTTTKEPLAQGITDEQVAKLIAERKGVGATDCKVVTENNQRFLVCQWPP